MPQVAVNGVTLEYEVRGAGDPLLFVMGLGGQLTNWPEGFIDLFVEQGFQVIIFDNRDIGLSTQTDWKPPTQGRMLRSFLTRRPLQDVGYTVEEMADDAAGLLEALGITSAHVLGISMGGMISQELAIRHPERVRSLCSIMSNTGDRKNGGIAASLFAKMARDKPPTRETAVEDSVVAFESFSGPHFDPEEHRTVAKATVARSYTPAGIARQTAAIAATRDRTSLLANVLAPTLVIHGLADPLVKFSGGVATAKAIPGARMLAFPDMGHDLPRPRWEEICDEVTRNTRRAPAAAP